MGRRVTRGAVKQSVVRRKNRKGGSSSKTVAHTSPKDGISTLWCGKYIKHNAVPSHCYPNPGVTPEPAEDSDVEVLEPTINFSLNVKEPQSLFFIITLKLRT